MVDGRGDDAACVKFIAIVPRILVELTWDKADNFDLTVTEPDGTIINRNKLKSNSGGRLVRDQNVDACDLQINGREQILWPITSESLPLEGLYRVRVIERKGCNTGPAKWSFSVIIGGVNVLFKEGKSDGNKGLAGAGKFMYKRPT